MQKETLRLGSLSFIFLRFFGGFCGFFGCGFVKYLGNKVDYFLSLYYYSIYNVYQKRTHSKRNADFRQEFIRNADYTKDSSGNLMFKRVEKLNNTEAQELSEADAVAEQFVSETLVISPDTEEDSEKIEKMVEGIKNPTLARGGGSPWEDGWDFSGAIYAYLEVTYTTSIVKDKTHIHLDEVSGYHTRISSGVSVRDHYVHYTSEGFYVGGYQNESDYYYPTSSNWSFTPPSSWKAVDKDSTCLIGATYYLTVGRGDDTWNMKVANNPFES